MASALRLKTAHCLSSVRRASMQQGAGPFWPALVPELSGPPKLA